MEKLSKIFRGDEYSNKMEEFNQAIEQINEDYKEIVEKFNRIYYTIITPEKGKIELIFDDNKNIPHELRNKVTDTFNAIWK